MRKSIQQLLLVLSRFMRDVSEYFKKLGGADEPELPTSEAGQDEIHASEKRVPLAVEPPVIQVACISCGSVVELTGICQNCQGPVCERPFCRKEVYNEELDMRVIQCRNCAVAEPV